MPKQRPNKAAAPTAKKRSKQFSQYYGVIVFLLAFLLFANAIPNGYNLDDELVTRDHRFTSHGISAIPEILSSSYYEDNMGYAYEYRPVVLISFAIEHDIFGEYAPVSHFINVLLYALACGLLYKVLRRLLMAYPDYVSFAIAALFAAHTAHTEIVASIKNRDEILALIFALLTLDVAIYIARSGKAWLSVACAALFTVALMSKTSILSMVLIIPLGLLFFTDATATIVLLIGLGLLLPSYFLLNIGSGFAKFEVIVALGGTILGFTALKNYKTILQTVRLLTRRLNSRISSSVWHGDSPSVVFANVRTYRDVFRGMMPADEIWAWRPALFCLALGVVYFFLMLHDFFIPALLPLAILAVLSLRGGRSLSWWAASVFNICIAINCLYLFRDMGYLHGYAGLLSKYLAFMLVFGRRDIFWPTLITFLMIAFFEGYRDPVGFSFWRDNTIKTPEYILTLLTLPAVFLFANARVRLFLLVPLVLVILFNLWEMFGHFVLADGIYTFGLAAFVAAVLLLRYRRGIQVTAGAFVLPAMILLFMTKSIHEENILTASRGLYNKSVTGLQAATEKVNPPVIANAQNRPLIYTEQCVSAHDPASVRIGTSLSIVIHYLQKVILPYPLSFYYGYKVIQPQRLSDPISLLSLLVYLALLIVAMATMRRWPLVSFGVIVYLLAIISVSNYLYFVPGMMGDRFLLLPSLGWCLAAAAALYYLFVRDKEGGAGWQSIAPAGRGVFIGLLLLYSVLTVARNADWKDDLTLFRHDIKYADNSAQAHNLLALHLMQHATAEQDPALRTAMMNEALVNFKRAEEIYPKFFNVAYDIGRVYLNLNQPDSGLQSMLRAIAIDSTYPDVYKTVSDIYIYKKMYVQAAPYLERLIVLMPQDYENYSKLSYNYFLLKEYQKSLAVNRKAIELMPRNPNPYINIYRTYTGMGEADSARAILLSARKIFPGNRDIESLLNQTGSPR